MSNSDSNHPDNTGSKPFKVRSLFGGSLKEFGEGAKVVGSGNINSQHATARQMTKKSPLTAHPGSGTSAASATKEVKLTNSILSAAVKIKGSVTFDAPAVIQGLIEGDLVSSSRLIISETGFIKGTVKAKYLIVEGKIEGEVFSGNLNVKSTAIINGNVFTECLSIEEGASFEGSCKISQTRSKG